MRMHLLLANNLNLLDIVKRIESTQTAPLTGPVCYVTINVLLHNFGMCTRSVHGIMTLPLKKTIEFITSNMTGTDLNHFISECDLNN